MAIDYKKTAEEIVKVVKRENIISAECCATRLRLIVKDRESIKDSDVQKIDGVKGVFFNSDQYQIILGTGVVNKVYDEVVKLGITASSQKDDDKDVKKSDDKNKFRKFIRIFADVFVPIMPAMIATGLFLGLKGALINDSFLGLFNLQVSNIPVSVMTFMSVLTETTFAFLPALVCWSAFRVFGGSPILGILLGLMLVSPALPNAYLVANPDSGVKPIMLFGFIPIVGYQGSILPALIAGMIGSKLELKLRKIIPNIIDILATPFLTLLIMLLLSLAVIGPIFHTVEQWILIAINFSLSLPFGLGGLIIGFGIIFIVVTGVHHIMNLIEISLLAATSLNPINPLLSVANLAAGAACLAVTLKTRRKSVKAMGYGATLSAWLGITEPAIFGINIRYGIKPMVCGAIASGITGLIVRLLNLQGTANGVTGIPGILLYIYDTKQLIGYISAAILTIVLSFTITWFFGVPKEYMQEDDE
ncbi:PTS transporter subunit EIIC [uncultured Brachyspira sp.]|uniref:PTS transporter subunit EIIC n=1 Tax=uncultured Brachyspira sp. TaxID=221953 RepID=UPI00262E63CD|nr:PTS transporter subunit EIIC [uncultured Brachyspira sp.]